MIPAGLEETEPVPVPVLDTVSVGVFKVKVAVTDRAWSRVTTHVLVPVQPSPDHPVKSELTAGVAVRVTTVPNAKLVEQVLRR